VIHADHLLGGDDARQQANAKAQATLKVLVSR
jgi:hypothetical protein